MKVNIKIKNEVHKRLSLNKPIYKLLEQMIERQKNLSYLLHSDPSEGTFCEVHYVIRQMRLALNDLETEVMEEKQTLRNREDQ